MSLIDILGPAIKAYSDATSGKTPVEDAVDNVAADPRVRLAMRMGALLEGGNLVGGWQPGDSGTSFGPWQIHLPAHAGVTAEMAEDPHMAAGIMAPEYFAAVDQVPPDMWASDPKSAATLAAFYAERPLNMYDPDTVESAWQQLGVHTVGQPTPSTTPVPGQTPAPGDTTPGGGFSASDFGGASGKVIIKGYKGRWTVFDDQGNVLQDLGPMDPTAMDLADIAQKNASANAEQANATTAASNAATSRMGQQETARQNRVQDAIDYITRLTAAQAAEDARQQAGQKNQLDALPYLTHAANFPGFGPNDPAVRLGLVPATPVTAMPFDPTVKPGANSQALQQQLAMLQAMAAGGQ